MDELVVIEPFHGDTMAVYKDVGGTWTRVWSAPLAFGQLIVRVLGAYAIIYGISLIVLAFRVRKLGKALKE